MYSQFFKHIHSNNLVYNLCWEDPRIDRQLLHFSSDSRVLMITSAGCNALTYLLDDVEQIHCVDLNHRQNALLELKIRLFEHTNFETLFSFFGKGYHPEAKQIYQNKLRPHLLPNHKQFWDEHIQYVEKGTFYYSGSSGALAKVLIKRLDRLGLRPKLNNLFKENDSSKKVDLFDEIFFTLFPSFLSFIVNSPFIMSFLGVPKGQIALIHQHESSVYHFIYKSLKHVFTELNLDENYFYKYYINGEVDKTFAPDYLMEENFDYIKQRVERISLFNGSVQNYLEHFDRNFSHFILLDHQDWMATNATDALKDEWKWIVKRANEGAKILLRSAGISRDFLPNSILDRCSFDDENCLRLHQYDRVGTYASTHLAELHHKKIN